MQRVVGKMVKLKKDIPKIIATIKLVSNEINIKRAQIEWKTELLEQMTLVEKLNILEVLSQGQLRFHEDLSKNLKKHLDWIKEFG